jgi:hypothetical protein
MDLPEAGTGHTSISFDRWIRGRLLHYSPKKPEQKNRSKKEWKFFQHSSSILTNAANISLYNCRSIANFYDINATKKGFDCF